MRILAPGATADNDCMAAMAVAATGSESQTEEARVLAWRLERLSQAGFSGKNLVLLALSNEVDLHAAESLVRRGCPVATAARILM